MLPPPLIIFYHAESDCFFIENGDHREQFPSMHDECHEVSPDTVPKDVLDRLYRDNYWLSGDDIKGLFEQHVAVTTKIGQLAAIVQNRDVLISEHQFRQWAEDTIRLKQELETVIKNIAQAIKSNSVFEKSKRVPTQTNSLSL